MRASNLVPKFKWPQYYEMEHYLFTCNSYDNRMRVLKASQLYAIAPQSWWMSSHNLLITCIYLLCHFSFAYFHFRRSIPLKCNPLGTQNSLIGTKMIVHVHDIHSLCINFASKIKRVVLTSNRSSECDPLCSQSSPHCIGWVEALSAWMAF